MSDHHARVEIAACVGDRGKDLCPTIGHVAESPHMAERALKTAAKMRPRFLTRARGAA